MTVSECSLMVTAQQNTVLAMATVNALKKTSYTPFGSGGREALLGFNGEMCERFARHYLLGHGHRIFIPSLMRFNRPDALSPFGAGGLNAYAYCSGDPINYQDPSGRMPMPKVRRPRVVGKAVAKAGDKAARRRDQGRVATQNFRKNEPLKVQATQRAIYDDKVDIKRRFSELEYSVDLASISTKMPENWAKDHVGQATRLYERFSDVYGAQLDPKHFEFYPNPATGMTELDIARFEVVLNYQRLMAKRARIRPSAFYPYKKIRLLRMEYYLNYYSPFTGTVMPLPRQ